METLTNVTGLADLQKALNDFPVQVEKKIMRGGLRAGMKPMLEAAKQAVPVKSSALRDSLRIGTNAKSGKVTATLKAGDKKAWYAYMVEFGTAAHFIQPKFAKALGFLGALVEGVHHPGSKKKPFMRPAMDTMQPQAIQAMADYLRQRIDKEQLKNLPDETDLVDK